jgi:hypothetical protein
VGAFVAKPNETKMDVLEDPVGGPISTLGIGQFSTRIPVGPSAWPLFCVFISISNSDFGFDLV